MKRLRARRLPVGALDREQKFRLQPPYAGIHGWAMAERGLDRVELSLDGGEPTRARLFATPRPDLGRVSRLPSAPICGWEAPTDIAGLTPGQPVTVSASAFVGGEPRSLGEIQMEAGTPRQTSHSDPEWLGTLRERAASGAAAAPDDTGELRVAVFTHQLDLGGAQLYLQELLRHLIADPRVTCAVYSQGDGELRAELEGWGVRVHITGQEPRLGSIYESRMAELAPFVGGFRPNVALVNTSLAFWGVDLAERLGIPAVWAIHESVPVHHYPHMVWPPFDEHLAERFETALRTCDRVVFEAQATRELYRPWVGDERATHIDYGIDLEAIERDRQELDRERLRALHGIAPDERVVLCMGTIEPRKAQASLAIAFARVAQDLPATSLVLVGDRDLPYSRAVREAVARMPVDARVRIEPISDRTSEWYELADAFALPSDLESVPRSILEAMTFELPILAADAFGVTEVVEDGVNGVVCEPRSLDSLTTALRRLLALPREELQELGGAGRELMLATRDSAGYGEAYLELMAQLAGQPAPAAGTAA